MTKRLKGNGELPEELQGEVCVDPGPAAEVIGVKKGTLANWRFKRMGPPYRKAGTKIVYPIAGLKAFLAAMTITPEA